METTIQKPTEVQALTIATEIKDKHLRNWHVNDISSAIERVGITQLGLINDVYISQGLFGQLCYLEYGDRRKAWKPFELNGWTVRQWRPSR